MKNLILNAWILAMVAAPLFTSCDDETATKEPESDVVANLNSGIMNGSLDEDFTLDADIDYSLTGEFTVEEGVTLTIPAGTKIVADASGSSVFIGVLMGGEIYVNGTSDAPVIMTSTNAEPGDWGGLTICGQATTSAGVDASAEVGGFVYGGTDDTDNSGSVTYLVISGTGAQINDESQYNGVSLYAVGSSTTVENLAIINGSDDGIEFFGGAVEVTNIYVENCEDDAIDWTEEWSGGITNTYISHTVDGFSTAFEGDKANAEPSFTNVTAISTVGGTALQFKKASGANITGLHLSGYDTNIDLANPDYEGASYVNIQIDGAAADTSAIYDATVVDVTMFDWKDVQ